METFVILLALLVVAAILAFALISEFGVPLADTPTRCPSCKRDGLARSRTPLLAESADANPLYECPHCGATYRAWELR